MLLFLAHTNRFFPYRTTSDKARGATDFGGHNDRLLKLIKGNTCGKLRWNFWEPSSNYEQLPNNFWMSEILVRSPIFLPENFAIFGIGSVTPETL